MKKRIFALAGLCLLALSACDKQPHPQPTPGPVVVDDECPRADGQPCR
jgi:hypothetical protein